MAARGWTRRASAARCRSARGSASRPKQRWRAFSDETGVPVAIIRLAGIYGPGRGPFEKIRRGTARRIVKPGQVFNRIHVDDIAADRRGGVRAASRRHLQRRRRRAGAAAGCADLCGGAARMPPPPRSSVRGRGAHADGAQLLRREQARAERQDQARARRAPRLSDLSRGTEGDPQQPRRPLPSTSFADDTSASGAKSLPAPARQARRRRRWRDRPTPQCRRALF